MSEIEFVPANNLKKHFTKGSVEWLSVLKARWNLKYTEMVDNDTDIIVMLYRANRNMIVAHYDKETKVGYVFDNRGEIR